jgi:TonB family protein
MLSKIFLTGVLIFSTSGLADERRSIIVPALGNNRIININECQPRYPGLARRLEVEGETTVAYQYDEQGKIFSAEIARTSGSTGVHKILDEEALISIKRCRVGRTDDRPGSRQQGEILAPIGGGSGSVVFRFNVEGSSSGPKAHTIRMHQKYPVQIPKLESARLIKLGENYFLVPEPASFVDGALAYWALSTRVTEHTKSALFLNVFDCRSATTRMAEIIYFRAPMAQGEVFYIDDPDPIGRRPSKITNNSILLSHLEQICRG